MGASFLFILSSNSYFCIVNTRDKHSLLPSFCPFKFYIVFMFTFPEAVLILLVVFSIIFLSIHNSFSYQNNFSSFQVMSKWLADHHRLLFGYRQINKRIFDF